MNTEQLIAAAAATFAKRRRGTTEHWRLLYKHQKLFLQPARIIYNESEDAGVFTEQQLSDGLSNREWQKLGQKLYGIYIVRFK